VKGLIIGFFVLFVFTLSLSIGPLQISAVQAAIIPYFGEGGGIISCSGVYCNTGSGGLVNTGKKACTSLCDLLTTGQNVARLLMSILAFILVPIIFTIGGLMYMFSAGNPGRVTAARQMLTGTLIGLLVGLGAFIILNTFFTALALTGNFKVENLVIKCPANLPGTLTPSVANCTFMGGPNQAETPPPRPTQYGCNAANNLVACAASLSACQSNPACSGRQCFPVTNSQCGQNAGSFACNAADGKIACFTNPSSARDDCANSTSCGNAPGGARACYPITDTSQCGQSVGGVYCIAGDNKIACFDQPGANNADDCQNAPYCGGDGRTCTPISQLPPGKGCGDDVGPYACALVQDVYSCYNGADACTNASECQGRGCVPVTATIASKCKTVAPPGQAYQCTARPFGIESNSTACHVTKEGCENDNGVLGNCPGYHEACKLVPFNTTNCTLNFGGPPFSP
jgi:hypothetical protein